MSISLKNLGDSLEGLAWGLFTNRTDHCLGQLDRVKVALQAILRKWSKTYPEVSANLFIEKLVERIGQFEKRKGCTIVECVELINKVRIISCKIINVAAQPDTIVFPIKSCSEAFEGHFPIPNQYMVMNKDSCNKAFLKIIETENGTEICKLIQIGAHNYLDPRFLEPKHLQIMLEADPTCLTKLVPLCQGRPYLGAILYFSGLINDGLEDNIKFYISSKLIKLRESVLEEVARDIGEWYNPSDIILDHYKSDRASLLQFLNSETDFKDDEYTFYKTLQTALRTRIIYKIIEEKCIGDFSSVKADLSKRAFDVVKDLRALKKLPISILNIIIEYSLFEEIVWKGFQNQHLAIIEKERAQEREDERRRNSKAFGVRL